MGYYKVNEVRELISQNNWDLLIEKFQVVDVCKLITFEEAMHLVEHLFYDDIRDDVKQQFALKLVFEIEKHFKKEWEEDWKNDVFLGQLCSVLWLYDERYFFYKRAYNRLKDPPEALLLLLSSCNNAPGTPPITDEQSESYLLKAIQNKVTYESASKMKNLFERKGDKAKAAYWMQISKKLEKEGIRSEEIIPDVLNH